MVSRSLRRPGADNTRKQCPLASGDIPHVSETRERSLALFHRMFVEQAGARFARKCARVTTMMLALGLCACASPSNQPSNLPLAETTASLHTSSFPDETGSTAIILAFYGGGARSAAFGYGVLSALAEQPARDGTALTLADQVAAVAGVSGGGILAAHFALYGPAGLGAFRRDYLDQDPEAALRTAITPVNLLRGYRGGVNDLTGFGAWLDAHLYHGATLGSLDRGKGPLLLLHATDLYNRAPFAFDRASFRAICSDYDSFPLAHAVAASSAVPVLFAPVVLENFSPDCPLSARKAATPGRSTLARHVEESQKRYETEADLRYLKLLDGGLVDNLAVHNLVRAMNRPTPAPLRAGAARHLRRVILIVADASLRIGGDLSKTVEGPGAVDTITASIDAMIDTGSRTGLDMLEHEAGLWRERLIRWRCGGKDAERDCDRLDVTVVRLSLADVRDAAEKARILQLSYKLSLKADEVDFLSGLGRRQLLANADYRRLFGARGALRTVAAR